MWSDSSGKKVRAARPESSAMSGNANANIPSHLPEAQAVASNPRTSEDGDYIQKKPELK
jgi:hypothetical protein